VGSWDLCGGRCERAVWTPVCGRSVTRHGGAVVGRHVGARPGGSAERVPLPCPALPWECVWEAVARLVTLITLSV
jgi:hypothetical protein